jgi:hypothetical protein
VDNDRSMTVFALADGTPFETRRLELALQCAGAQIDELRGPAEHARLRQALRETGVLRTSKGSGLLFVGQWRPCDWDRL